MDMQSMAQLMQMMMSNSNEDSDEDDNGTEDPSPTDESEENEDSDGDFDFGDMFGNINFDMLNKMGELFSHMNKKDRNAELLLALKPHLRDENQHKIDRAMSMSKMMAMIPFIKESGMLNDLF